jgi:hypothetical protein
MHDSFLLFSVLSFSDYVIDTYCLLLSCDVSLQGVAPGREAVGRLSVLTSVVVGHSVLVNEGPVSMFRYGILTACQVIPGFVTFVSAK